MDAFVEMLLHRMLATSVQTVLLSAVVWALCRYLPRLSPAAQCWLWWLVALQALCGLMASPVELPWLLRQTPAVLPQVVADTNWNVGVLDGATTTHAETEAVRPLWPALVFSLWVGGVLFAGWYALCDWRRGRRLLKLSAPCAEGHLPQMLSRVAAFTGRRGVPQLRLSYEIESPLLIGLFRPTLLLPVTSSLSDAELEMALTHELAHLRRGDLWWGWVPLLARLLFFFHPLAHLAVREYCIAREAACDAAVVDASHRSRRDYGRLLLRLGTATNSSAGLAAASPTFHALRRRLTMLQHTAFLSRAGSLTLVVLVAAVGVMPVRLVAAAATGAPTASAPPAAADATPVPTPTRQPKANVARAATPATGAGEEEAANEAVGGSMQRSQEILREREAVRRRLDELKARRDQASQTTGATQGARSLDFNQPPTQARAALLQAVMLQAQARSLTNHRLEANSRPTYEALFGKYEAECRAEHARTAVSASSALQRADCLEQAELRAYNETLAAEKEALVEQRRRAAMGLPPVESNPAQESRP